MHKGIAPARDTGARDGTLGVFEGDAVRSPSHGLAGTCESKGEGTDVAALQKPSRLGYSEKCGWGGGFRSGP